MFQNYHRIAAVSRNTQFSPNHINNDAAIFDATLNHLEQEGYFVTHYTEAQLCSQEMDENNIITMCRHPKSVQRLCSLQKQGVTVLNSAFGIENCTREKMTRLLMSNHVAHPDSLIVNTNTQIAPLMHQSSITNCWVKRGDFHAVHKEDVSYAHTPQEAQEILNEYALRGISRAVINRHLVGDLIKFYGVVGSNFFYWFYPLEHTHSKFGNEAINGYPKGIDFKVEELQNLCLQASRILQIEIYGGDCIISPDGSLRIIDFNDWPSFAPCRTQAAWHIAQAIVRHTTSISHTYYYQS